VGHAQKFASLIFFLAALAAPSLRADDRSAEKPIPQEVGQKEGQKEESPRDSSAAASTKKRGLIHRWLRMADKVQATQPDWLSPVATTSGRLKQEFRYDVFDQPVSGGNRLY
jgi:hypothetical protein